jgi:hypothetical protein
MGMPPTESAATGNEFYINGRKFVRLADEVDARIAELAERVSKEQERAEALGGFDVPQTAPEKYMCDDCPKVAAWDNGLAWDSNSGACCEDVPHSETVTLRNAALDELSAEIERRRKELTAWGARVNEAAESAPAWANVGFAPEVDECCFNDVLGNGPMCDDCPDAYNPDERITGGDDAIYCECEYCKPRHGNVLIERPRISDNESIAIDAVVDMLYARGVSADEIIRRLVAVEERSAPRRQVITMSARGGDPLSDENDEALRQSLLSYVRSGVIGGR